MFALSSLPLLQLNHPARARRGSIAAIAAILIVMCAIAPKRATAESLRGYGAVTAKIGTQSAVFQCRDATAANNLFGKFLADLFWDGNGNVQKTTVAVGAQTIPAYSWTPYGLIAAAQIGARVILVGGSNPAQMAANLRRAPLMLSSAARFTPASPYPRYLDFYDLRAFKFYTVAMTSQQGDGLDSHWDFIKKFGLGGTAFQEICYVFASPAPSVVEWSPYDYEVSAAQSAGGITVPSIELGGPLPLWVRNDVPSVVAAHASTALFGGWGTYGTAGAAFQTYAPDVPGSDAGDLAFLKAAMARYGSSPALGGWQFYGGQPGDEFGLHDRTTAYWDYSPRGQEAFRAWLRGQEGYSLAALGQRWYGDPSHFRSWSDVSLPDLNSFFGDLGNNTFALDGDWKRHAATGIMTPPSDDDGQWLATQLVPSQQQDFIPGGPGFYAKTFDASDWLAKNPGRPVFLVCDLNTYASQGAGVWINGTSLGDFKAEGGGAGPFSVEITKSIHPGSNDLVIRDPGDAIQGRIYGPVFLTATQPKQYPNLGKQANARYVDLCDWQSYALYARHDTLFNAARRLDPNRPMLLASSDLDAVQDYSAKLATDYGTGIEFTGREAWYFPWWSGLGYVDGFYSTGEASGTPHGDWLDRMLSWMLYDGDSSHCMFYDIEDFIKEEHQTGWFTKHRRLLHLFGKVTRQRPSVVVLRSSLTTRLGDTVPDNWDLGRGELQEAHFDNVYATETEVEAGRVDSYPVMIDSGSEVMDGKIIASLRDYVAQGGVFVAFSDTGKNSVLEPDTYPISTLTGYKILSAHASGTIHFGAQESLVNGWAGRTAAASGLSLAPTAAGTIPIALWNDGTVAIGARRIGKGLVITLGSPFWRSNGVDPASKQTTLTVEDDFLQSLLAGLNIARQSNSDSTKIWTRMFTTKNGLQDWMIAFNNTGSATTAGVSFRTAVKPGEVIDMVAQSPVPFTYADGWVHVDPLAFDPNGVRVLGVNRGSLIGGVATWWAEKQKYWRAVSTTPESIDPPTDPGIIDCTRWQFATDPDNAISTGSDWQTGSGPKTAAWQTIGTDPIALQSPRLKGYHGAALYRFSFTRPAVWTGKSVRLNLYSANSAIVYDRGDFYLNGHLVTTYVGHGGTQTLSYEINQWLMPGKNTLAVKVQGGQTFTGISGAAWFSAERPLQAETPLGQGWQLVGADLKSATDAAQSAQGSGKVTGSHIVRAVDIPSDWKGKRTFLRVRTPDQWLDCIVVNGQPITFDIYAHLFGNLTEVDITPYAHYGAANTIELWPQATIPGNSGLPSTPTAQFPLPEVSIGHS